MRELKFRGLNEKGKWIYGDLIQTNPNSVDGDSTCWIKPRSVLGLGAVSTPTSAFEKVITKTVGQFTGAYNESGDEIWEGDIYWNGDEDFYPTVVSYDKNIACFVCCCPNGSRDDFYTLEYGNYIFYGNTHEHPHLLEDKR